jgi:magnesium chelatase family protein
LVLSPPFYHRTPQCHHRILKLARTIAGLAQSKEIEIVHLSEAISYRKLDRQ